MFTTNVIALISTTHKFHTMLPSASGNMQPQNSNQIPKNPEPDRYQQCRAPQESAPPPTSLFCHKPQCISLEHRNGQRGALRGFR
jgi:hypothetical protein